MRARRKVRRVRGLPKQSLRHCGAFSEAVSGDEVRWRERPSEAVSEALLEALRRVRSIWGCQKAVSDGHIKTECGQGTRWDGVRGLPKQSLRHWDAFSEAVSEALLEALRRVRSIWGCQKAVSDGHKNKNRVRARHEVRGVRGLPKQCFGRS